MLQQLREDTRAQPVSIGRFFLSLLVGAILFMAVLSQVAPPILKGSMNATGSAKANQATQWFQMLVDYYPVIILMICFMGLVVTAIFQRARLR